MYINADVLAEIIANGQRTFWCESEDERVALFEALDTLGYKWNSDDSLMGVNVGANADIGVRYMLTDNLRVLYGTYHYVNYGEMPVAELTGAKSSAVDPCDLMAIMGV